MCSTNLQEPRGAIPVPPDTPAAVVTVIAEDDSLAEADEQFTVKLTTANPDGSPGVALGRCCRAWCAPRRRVHSTQWSVGDLILEAERSEGTDPNAAPEHDVTLEGSFRW